MRIQESREVQISGVVVKRSDLRSFAKIIDEAAAKIPDDEKYSQSYHLSADGHSYSSQEPALLNEDSGILDRAHVTRFDARLSAKNANINLVIVQTREPSRTNKLSVSGSDRQWVAGTMQQFEDQVQALQPQRPGKLGRRLLAGAAAAGFVVAVGVFAARVPTDPDTSLPAILFSAVMISASVGFLIALIVSEIVTRLWPDVEMQTGRAHMNVQAQTRKRWWVAMSTVILPFLVSLAAGLLILQ